jgi:hypothetical protein
MRPVTCPACHTSLPVASLNTPNPVGCPRCRKKIRVLVFPAHLAGPRLGTAPRQVLGEGESDCFYHPGKQAIIVCDHCGRFLCSLCDVELGTEHLCPACVETGSARDRLKDLRHHRTLYDSLALGLATLPLLLWPFTLVTAPAAIYVVVRHWKSPSSLFPRSRWRMLVAFPVALAQVIGWGALFTYLLLA